MSTTQVNTHPSTKAVPGSPTIRRTVTSASDYEAAERAVDWLSDRGHMAPGGPTSTRKATVRR